MSRIVLSRPPRTIFPEVRIRHDGWAERIERGLASLLSRAGKPFSLASEWRVLRRIDALGAEMQTLDDAGLRRRVEQCRAAIRRGIPSTEVPTLFALVREWADRTLGTRPYDAQLRGGLAILRGRIAEMQTGEGKTLTATLPACAAGLAGIPVHVVTANDYLAARDADKMRPLYEALGIRVGVVVDGMAASARRAAYQCDVTYCSSKELAFDYLRDSVAREAGTGDAARRLRLMAGSARSDETVMHGLFFAVVDEADSVLVDEARTPLILARDEDAKIDRQFCERALEVASSLQRPADYTLHAGERSILLSDLGRTRIRELTAGFGGLWETTVVREEAVTNGLAALHLYNRDEHYIVRDGAVAIVDEYTGRVMKDRSWGEGLHQLIEVKEGCPTSSRRTVLARMTYQRFFARYPHLGGMTGTAREIGGELRSVYRLPVQTVAPHRPCRRRTWRPQITRNAAEKWRLVTASVAREHGAGRPVLVGTRSVAASLEAHAAITGAGLQARLLSAAQDAQEADVVAQAGVCGVITIATNMAGRGTDIALAPEAVRRGGLHVIMTEHHDSRRIDRQLAGRCARQGDPGSVETIVSLDDAILAAACVGIAGPVLQRLARTLTWQWLGRTAFRHAQRRAERTHAAIRRQVLRHDRGLNAALAFSGEIE